MPFVTRTITQKDSAFRKVGRMAIRNDGLIHIYVDGSGEVGTMTQTDAALILDGMRPKPIYPSGQGDLSLPETGFKMVIDGVLYVAIVRQVETMLDNPYKRAAVFSGG